ncbi:aldo/keto reductase [Streptomyces kronopolitis]|uniref:aldo/keto reductase n=1 Tax=Streptomyces kronopolitis TaxID=1612435 RepID=UPI00341F1D71
MIAHDLAARHLCRGILAHPLGLHCEVSAGQDASAGPTNISGFLDGLHRAVEHVEHGAIFLDTADSYGCGHSERMIGRFVRDHQDLPLYLSSKVGRVRGSAPHPFAGRHIHHQFEQSLENLYAEQLDLYTLETFDFGPADRYLGNAIDSVRTLRELESIKAIGMRGPHADYTSSPGEWEKQAERFLYLFRLIKPDVVWTRFNAFTPAVLLDGEDLFSFTARHGVGLVLAAPLAHGVLTGSRAGSSPSHRPASQGLARLTPPLTKRISEGLQALRDNFGSAPGTLTRLALRSCLQRGDNCVVVVGFSNEEQVEENYSCLGPALTEQELGLVDEIYVHLRGGLQELQEDSVRCVAEEVHV